MARKFDKEFKINAVRLLLEKGLKPAQVCADLGIGKSTLARWKDELQKHGLSAFPGKGHLHPEEERFKKLERENANLKQERDILKKALAIFSSR